MFLVDILGWWYVSGWEWVINRLLIERSKSIVEFFSVGTLLRTLFAPFRQTYVAGGAGSLGNRLRAFGDRSISRAVGFVVRFFLILTALILLTLNLIFAVAGALLWPFIPLSPIVAVVMWSLGVSHAI